MGVFESLSYGWATPNVVSAGSPQRYLILNLWVNNRIQNIDDGVKSNGQNPNQNGQTKHHAIVAV